MKDTTPENPFTACLVTLGQLRDEIDQVAVELDSSSVDNCKILAHQLMLRIMEAEEQTRGKVRS